MTPIPPPPPLQLRRVNDGPGQYHWGRGGVCALVTLAHHIFWAPVEDSDTVTHSLTLHLTCCAFVIWTLVAECPSPSSDPLPNKHAQYSSAIFLNTTTMDVVGGRKAVPPSYHSQVKRL